MSNPTTPQSTTEMLVITSEQRERIQALFTTSQGVLLKRVRALMPYHAYTVDQVIAALHEAADRDDETLVLTKSERTTMAKSLAVVRAWVVSKADDVVEEGHPSKDPALTNLAKIAGIDPAALTAYEIPKEDRGEDGIRYRPVVIEPRADKGETFEPYTTPVDFGTGLKALPDIVAAYMSERLQGEDEGDDWLTAYRFAVEYANNERRRANQAHDTRAAYSRVGQGDGGNKGGGKARPGGNGKGENDTPSTPVADHRQRGEKTVGEASTLELIKALTARVSDHHTAMTLEDTRAWSVMEEIWEKRFDVVAVGQALDAPQVEAEPEPTPEPTPQPAPVVDTFVEPVVLQNEINRAPVPQGSADALLRAIMAELTAPQPTPVLA